MKIQKEFRSRPADEQAWMSENTWCSTCGKADLGMIEVVEYEEDGQRILEGNCRKCGSRIQSFLEEKNVEP